MGTGEKEAEFFYLLYFVYSGISCQKTTELV